MTKRTPLGSSNGQWSISACTIRISETTDGAASPGRRNKVRWRTRLPGRETLAGYGVHSLVSYEEQ